MGQPSGLICSFLRAVSGSTRSRLDQLFIVSLCHQSQQYIGSGILEERPLRKFSFESFIIERFVYFIWNLSFKMFVSKPQNGQKCSLRSEAKGGNPDFPIYVITMTLTSAEGLPRSRLAPNILPNLHFSNQMPRHVGWAQNLGVWDAVTHIP